MRYFQDIQIGETALSSEYTVSADEIVAFARQFDPMPIHTSEEAGRKSQFGGLIASGTHTLALWRKLDFDTSGDISAICGLGVDKLRFIRPLYAGDTIRSEYRVVSNQLSKTQENWGIVHFVHKITNQHGNLVSSHSTRVLVRCAEQE